jgi:MFS family permease
MGATESGLNLLPLVFALIVGATVSGQLAARTGRYKPLIFGSMVVLAAGLFLLTNLQAATDLQTLWLWMIVAGLGVGPSFALFAALVQNNVEPRQIGSATASLTFFQQIGGTIGLTLAGTALADKLATELPARLTAAGVPPAFAGQLQGGSAQDLTGTGDLGARILAGVPPAFQAQVAPLIPGIVNAIREALAVAIASTFWIGIVAALIAAVAVLFLHERPIRGTSGPEAVAPMA